MFGRRKPATSLTTDPSDARGRVQQPPPPARMNAVRGLPHTYEINEWAPWGTSSTVPAANWARGPLVRGSQPVFALAPPAPAWDKSDPSWWNRSGVG